MQAKHKRFNQVLIIDDDEVSSYLSQTVLQEMQAAEEIHTLTNAITGLEFLKERCLNQHAAKKECPDLILLDINMPGKDGYDFLDELLELQQSTIIQTVVVVLSSSTSRIDQAKMQAYGVRGYLEKPIQEEILLKLF